ncbi:MAG TPA: hypothetical protein PLH65_02770 [bacterium]|nr:hypothetical protein [bacterium]
MDLNKIISNSFNITFKHRYLWLLSFLAIIGGVASENQVNFNFNFPSELLSNSSAIQSIESTITDSLNKIELYLPIILIALGIIFIIFIILFFTGLVAKAGMINSIMQVNQNQTSSFSQSLSFGQNFIWRLFLLRLLFGLIYIGLSIVSVIIVIFTFLLFFITIPLVWLIFTILGIIYKNAEIIMIRENLGVIASIQNSWQLFLKEWKNIGILWLIKLLFDIVLGIFGFVLSIIVFVFSIFIVVLGVFFVISLQNQIITIVGISFGSLLIVLLICLGIFIGSIVNTFFTSYWTLGINDLYPSYLSSITPTE